jgi:hypothetical protein
MSRKQSLKSKLKKVHKISSAPLIFKRVKEPLGYGWMCEKDETRENGKNEYVEREREREI